MKKYLLALLLFCSVNVFAQNEFIIPLLLEINPSNGFLEPTDPNRKFSASYFSIPVGTSANNILQLDATGKVPISNIPSIIVSAAKTADETVNNSNTLQADDALTVSVAANSVYKVELFLKVVSDNVAGFKLAMDAPTANIRHDYNVFGNTTSSSAFIEIGTASTAEDPIIANGQVLVSSADAFLILRGLLTTGINAGNYTVQWAQSAATAIDTKVLRGSYLKLIKE